MDKLSSNITYNSNRRIYNRIFRIIFLLVVASVIWYFFPKTGNFYYEYQKGGKWNYPDLVAPYDFPIYKNEAVLTENKDQIKEQEGLIYILNSTVENTNVARLEEELSNTANTIPNTIKIQLADHLKSLYQNGIYIVPDKYLDTKIGMIRVLDKNQSEIKHTNEVFTPKEAYQNMLHFIDTLDMKQDVRRILLRMDFAKYINPNLIFSKEKSNLFIEEALKGLALTQGIVNKNDLILSKNEYITQEKFDILESLKQSYSEQYYFGNDKIGQDMGKAIIIILGILIFTLFLLIHKKFLYYNLKEFVFLYSLFLASVGLVLAAQNQNMVIYAVPFLFFVIIVNILIDYKTALYLLISTVLISSFIVVDRFEFLFMQTTAGVIAIFSLAQLQRRSQLFVAIVWIYFGYIASYVGFQLIFKEELLPSTWSNLVWLFINCLLLMLSYLAIYLFEKLFGFTSEISLIELSNPNHPVLRALTKKAPGTFQHSMMVANLAEEAIYRIGGDPLLARTGAMYHDIGKMCNPVYFIENQSGGCNPHDKLDYNESAGIIISHVKEGVELAKKYNLPNSIIDFIKTHHGKNKVKYFYNSYKNKYPDKVIDEDAFTYKGPDPQSKECAVVMLADSVEAVSRTLKEKSEENIEAMVNRIIDGLIAEGRLNRAQITFNDINIVKNVFINMLTNIYHSRISYPKIETPKKEE